MCMVGVIMCLGGCCNVSGWELKCVWVDVVMCLGGCCNVSWWVL